MTENKAILVVDDSRLSRMMVKSFVNTHYPGWLLKECSNADEASDAIRDTGFDLAIVDYNMPGKNGMELVETIRAHSPETKVCLLTANIQDSLKQQADEMGVRFFGKPITEELILTIISMVA